MKKIKYEVNGKLVEIEVTDSFAESYEIINLETKRNDWKHERRSTKYNSSLDLLVESGFQIVSEEPTPDEKLEKQEDISLLRQALFTLTEDQQWLIKEVYFKGRSQVEIAKELGILKSSLNDRLSRALKKIKKFLN
ncbi:MAG: sigma-70 family RNA polymerase sigma factor [Clostridiales bacterium]|nr:sigma-70 family RNA polymerase sigma factor [Clostridiales bacterium]